MYSHVRLFLLTWTTLAVRLPTLFQPPLIHMEIAERRRENMIRNTHALDGNQLCKEISSGEITTSPTFGLTPFDRSLPGGI